MFFVIFFLALAASVAYVFPEWSWVTVLMVSFGGVAALRIALGFSGRSTSAAAKSD